MRVVVLVAAMAVEVVVLAVVVAVVAVDQSGGCGGGVGGGVAMVWVVGGTRILPTTACRRRSGTLTGASVADSRNRARSSVACASFAGRPPSATCGRMGAAVERPHNGAAGERPGTSQTVSLASLCEWALVFLSAEHTVRSSAAE